MSARLIGWLAPGALAFLWLLSGSLFSVSEIEQALVIRLGAPVGAVTQPGLKLKLPMIDSVVYYDARLVTLEPPLEQVILGDQKRVEVKTYARYRVADPLKFYQAVRTLPQADLHLTQLLSSSLRRELGQTSLSALLSDKRQVVVQQIQNEVSGKGREIGVDVIEVRFHRLDLPLETSQAIYERMKSERQREAKELRAQGFEWAQQIQAKADRERTVILSEAQRQAKIIHGEGDASANQILSGAFGRDPQFYRFYRSLQTYRQALAESAPTIVLSPDAELLRHFRNGPGAPSRP